LDVEEDQLVFCPSIEVASYVMVRY
jgi:hypothetical protein